MHSLDMVQKAHFGEFSHPIYTTTTQDACQAESDTWADIFPQAFPISLQCFNCLLQIYLNV